MNQGQCHKFVLDIDHTHSYRLEGSAILPAILLDGVPPYNVRCPA
jgi:hypothetical protein